MAGQPEECESLVSAYLVDPQGQTHKVGWQEITSWGPEKGFLWVHLHRRAERTHTWLTQEAGLDPLIAEALLAEETRPRVLSLSDCLLVLLRGVNLNPGTDPEDMVSIRLWLEPSRVISLRAQRLLAAQDIRESMEAGRGPGTSSEFLPMIAAQLLDRMSPVLQELDERIDAIEEQLLEEQSSEMRAQLSASRRQAISLRRYLAPQRDVLARLSIEPVSWLKPLDQARLRELADRVTRYIEDLDAARERAAVTQEELANRLSERMNSTMYVLSIVAALFLPLGFLTGLLGINVGGIPGTENQLAFATVCLIIIVIVGMQLWFFRRREWF